MDQFFHARAVQLRLRHARLAGQIQDGDELVRIQILQHVVKTAHGIAARGQDDAFAVLFLQRRHDAAGKSALVGMRAAFRLRAQGAVRLQQFHLRTHGLQQLHRRVFADIADHFPPPAFRTSVKASKRVLIWPSCMLRRSSASESRISIGVPFSAMRFFISSALPADCLHPQWQNCTAPSH